MITISNSISFVRAPLALLFLQQSPGIRLCAILLAMLTDCVDGYIARRYKSTSQFGAILDPAMDKFFVFFVFSIFHLEGKISVVEIMAMLSRDFFVFTYGFIMTVTGRWKTIVFRSIRWGKITTALQFCVLMALCFDMPVPQVVYTSFVAMGCLAFVELFRTAPSTN